MKRLIIGLVFALLLEPRTQAADSTADWFAFQPTNDASTESIIGMADWQERPAGKQGRITRDGERLVYAGQPIKLWGLNLSYGSCAPDKALADKRAAFYAKYGINAVRLHKWADDAGWGGIQSAESAVEFDPAALDRMDYQVAKLKEAGIYVLLSAHFGAMKLGPADRQYVPFLEEFGKFEGGKKRVITPHSAIHYSPTLQAVHIRQTLNLLRHKNPYTGLTYAADPAVAFVEIINEQSILFYTSMGPLKASPTLRKQAGEAFSGWLKAKYGDAGKLKAAWGDKALDSFTKDGFPAGESLDQRNILPLGNPFYWEPAQLDGSQSFRRQRMLDTLEFLTKLQDDFYDRYMKAMREAGYQGEFIASNWQAGRACSHFMNLHSDWRVGTIDRHNYFGGGGGGRGKKAATFNNASMLRVAGSATLSSGLQQAADRPFMLSEWIHVFPNEWGVEGPALLGAYGYGLQGWDASFMFQNGDGGNFSDRIGRNAWDVTAPQILGVFPAVARQVRRGDVKESELQATMNVHIPSLLQGKIGFSDKTTQGYDLKGFDCDKVPARALAVARCAVQFTEAWRETPTFDLKPFEKNGFLVSSTGQLQWKEGGAERLSGFFTVDTPATKAVVGFAGGQTCRLGDVTIAPQGRFAAIYVTAREQGATLQTAKSVVIVALARARNTGMKFNETEDQLLDRGQGPILMEPVKAMLELGGRAIKAVNILDHDGRRTGRTLPLAHGRIAIDTARDKTIYYEVTF